MQTYKNSSNVNETNDSTETYSYQGSEVIIITVFKTGVNSVAIVEDVNTGEQFEVFRDQLY
ncbi:hypothetical protein [Candidatus Sulfurimonas baltica]|uniref:Uncharacterized protein n=1 Tax=Candidatus Sulfurimonas baltica TaxID=2740404 RepID=A0A7S7RNY2_9BACT|nr:hypothetical protein [Candidatus Sulfurimonas baltica]QOY50925.1 hypothetical protein HUE88_07150 [Candidatus Sulfurimonas baltica]QOY53021.1 hypothetical protein HUE88_04890 [Candidatus Sulfurimonas baltica]